MSDTRYYRGYKLTDYYNILSEKHRHFDDKIWAASIYSKCGYRLSMNDVYKITGVSAPTLCRFIHYELNDISPPMYNACISTINRHKRLGPISANDTWLKKRRTK